MADRRSASANEDLALKVMRLYKPSLAPASRHTKLNPSLSPSSFVPDLLRLPDNFGSIFVGQSFSSYISVCNGGEHDVKNVQLTAELQTGKKRFSLLDRRAQMGSGGAVPAPAANPQANFAPGASLDMVVQHRLTELGVHVLRVCVEFDARRTGERKSFKKFYRFSVLRPFTITTRIALLSSVSGPNAAEGLLLAAEVGVHNASPGSVVLTDLLLEGAGRSVEVTAVKPVDADLSTDALVTPSHARLRAGEACSQVFLLRTAQLESNASSEVAAGSAAAAAPGRAPSLPRRQRSLVTLGRVVVEWRGSFGEEGRYVSPHMIEWRVAPGSSGEGSVSVASRRGSGAKVSSGGPELQVILTPPSAPLVVGQTGAFAHCVVHNHTGRPISASLTLEEVDDLNSPARSGVVVSGLTTRFLGALQPQSSLKVELPLQPLAAGVHGLGGIAVVDRQTGKSYRAGVVSIMIEPRALNDVL